MKKQDGYILVFALIVMTVSAVFVLAISSSAVWAYKRQARSLGALQEQYSLNGPESKLQMFEGSVNRADDVLWPDNSVGLQSVVDSFLIGVSVPDVNHGARTINVVQKTDSEEVIIRTLDDISVDFSFNEMLSLLADPDTKSAKCQINIPDIEITDGTVSLSAEMVITLDVQVEGSGFKLHRSSVGYSSYSSQEVTPDD